MRQVTELGHQLGLGGVGVEGLVAGVEARADDDAGGTAGHRPLAVGSGGDGAGGEHRDGRDGIDHRRQQIGEAVVVAAVAAGFVTLGDDDVGAGLGNAAGFVGGLHLAHGDGAGGVHDVGGAAWRRRTTARSSAPRGPARVRGGRAGRRAPT